MLSTVRDCMCVCVRACVRTFKVPVHACLWTGMFCLHCVRSCQVNTRLGPALLLLFARCAFQDVSRRRDHPAKETNTRSRSNTRSRTKGRPRQGAQTKAARSLARPSFRTTRRLHRNYSPRPPTNQPLESIGGELVWESGQWGGEIQRRGAAGSIQKTNWLHVCVFLFCVLFSLWRFAGNIGAELSYSNVGMFISSDAGNSWRQVRVTPVLIFRVCSVTAQLSLHKPYCFYFIIVYI